MRWRIQTVHKSMVESNTVVSAYTLYRHLQQYLTHRNGDANTVTQKEKLIHANGFIMSHNFGFQNWPEAGQKMSSATFNEFMKC